MSDKDKRHKTRYPGVFFRYVEKRPGPGKEKSYSVTYWKNGKLVEARVGKQSQGMSDKQAQVERGKLMLGETMTRTEAKRKAQEEAKAAQLAQEQERDRPTIGRLWEVYREQKGEIASEGMDRSRWNKYLAPAFADKEIGDIVTLDLDRLRMKMKKDGASPQTIKHVLALFRRIVRFGVQRGLCPAPDPSRLHIEMPRVNNQVTEFLTPDQVDRLLEALDRCDDWRPVAVVKIALSTGMRRSEILKLQWAQIDMERGFIRIVAPKGGADCSIPLNETARAAIQAIPRTDSPYLFPGKGGRGHVQDMNRPLREIKQLAGLPDDFRILHGLRHHFASSLASAGVPLHVVQRLLNHASPVMTQRYAHLSNEALLNGSAAMDAALSRGSKVVDLDQARKAQGAA
jgi:site-specific recombinase XerD